VRKRRGLRPSDPAHVDPIKQSVSNPQRFNRKPSRALGKWPAVPLWFLGVALREGLNHTPGIYAGNLYR
jgi:hypothetical protein